MFYFIMAQNYMYGEIADLDTTKRSPKMCLVREKEEVGYTPVMYRNKSIVYIWLMYFGFTYLLGSWKVTSRIIRTCFTALELVA